MQTCATTSSQTHAVRAAVVDTRLLPALALGLLLLLL